MTYLSLLPFAFMCAWTFVFPPGPARRAWATVVFPSALVFTVFTLASLQAQPEAVPAPPLSPHRAELVCDDPAVRASCELVTWTVTGPVVPKP